MKKMNRDNWSISYKVRGRSAPVAVDTHAFIKSFTKVFTIDLMFYPAKCNRITISDGSLIKFRYNDPNKMPEICDMVGDIDFVLLYADQDDTWSDKTELYEKAVIIQPYYGAKYPQHSNGIEGYMDKCVPLGSSKWNGMYNDNLLYEYEQGMDLTRVKNIVLAQGDFENMPEIFKDYHFNYVKVINIDDVDKLANINAEVLHIVINQMSDQSDFRHNWHRLLTKVKYFMMSAQLDDNDDVPSNITCDRLLAYDINYSKNTRMTWDILDEICESNRPRFREIKSARS